MSAMDNRLELWIGKLLDGAISPQERSLLENELQRDGRARDLLEQMRTLHECSCGVVTHEIFGRGADPEEIFERAWQQNKRSFWRRAVGTPKRDGSRLGSLIADSRLQLAVGVAAGFLLGLIVQFTPVRHTTPNLSNLPSRPPVAGDVPSGRGGPIGITPVVQTADPRQINRYVDWRVVTDRDGNQWLIEGTREGLVKPAAYRGSL